MKPATTKAGAHRDVRVIVLPSILRTSTLAKALQYGVTSP